MRSIALALLLSASLAAQGVSCTITPNPVPAGGTITIAVTEANNIGIQFPSSCNFSAIRQGSPTGPIVDGPFCLTVITPLGPCQTRTMAWSLLPSLGPGLYYVQVNYWDTGFSALTTEFFPFHIGSGAPLLAAGAPAQIGTTVPLTLSDPSSPGGGFICAASFTTNTGFSIGPGLFVSLDMDPIFALSFPSPDPNFFLNFQGTLDGAGAASMGLVLPNLPFLVCKPLHLQAVTVNGSLIRTSTVQNFRILP
jgi:hypothetical protein